MFDKMQGVSIVPEEEQKVVDALAALRKDSHAPREVSVKLVLTVHREYPKHVVVGKNEEGKPITKVVGNEQEEKAALASTKPAL